MSTNVANAANGHPIPLTDRQLNRSAAHATHNPRPGTPRSSNGLVQWICTILTLLYSHIFWRYIVVPIDRIANGTTRESQVKEAIGTWLNNRKSEAQYAQAAGALGITVEATVLTWPGFTTRYWVCPACLYSSLVLSLASVVFGAQQVLVIGLQTDASRCYKREYWIWRSGRRDVDEVRWGVLLAWQAPLMCLSYSLLLLLAGILAYVISPVVIEGKYGDETKILIFFLAFLAVFAAMWPVGTIVHHTVEAESQDGQQTQQNQQDQQA